MSSGVAFMSNPITKNLRRVYTKCLGHAGRRDPKLWVFGEWFGKHCCDNCLYLANYIAAKHPEIQCVWLCQEGADMSLLDDRVVRCTLGTEEAKGLLRRAGVVVMNQGGVDVCCDAGDLSYTGALTVNLWHGVPWKKIGMEHLRRAPMFKRLYGEIMQRFTRADVYLAVCGDMVKVFREQFCARPNGVIEAGYPRNALFYDQAAICAAREKLLRLLPEISAQYGENVRILSYMPTFRDQSHQTFSFTELEGNSRLRRMLEQYNAVIVQKAHFVTDQRGTQWDSHAQQRIFSLNQLSGQELLAATDVLITDYSSCFFDFLLLDRPIIHYLYDYEYYARQDRGLYYSKEDAVCGDAPETVEALLDAMEENLAHPEKHRALRAKRRQYFLAYEGANSCEAVFEEIQKRL